MKTQYFTSANIENEAWSMSDSLTEYIQRNRSTVAALESSTSIHHTSLLILDMQRFFLDPSSHAFVPSAPSIIPQILRLAALLRHAHRPVIATQHTNNIYTAGTMATWWRDLMQPDAPTTAISDAIIGIPPDQIIEKHCYDAFIRTDLESQLNHSNTHTVIITGVMTHICCETTARSAFQKGYNVIFPIDGTATTHVDFHLGTLRAVGHCCARIAPMKTVIEILSKQLRDQNQS